MSAAINVGELVAFVVRWSGIPALIRRTVSRRRASILLYHDPTPEVLERHLRYLRSRYNFVRLDEIVDALVEGRWERLPPRPLAVTFDDGHRGNARLVEVLRGNGVVPTIFLCSQIVATSRHFWFLDADDPEALKPLPNEERLAALSAAGFEQTAPHPESERQALSAEEIERMQDAVEFGAHSRFHPVLTACSPGELSDEVGGSKSEVERLTGRPCRHFAYPNGDYTEREIEAVRAAGFLSARTVDEGWVTRRSDPFALRVLGTSDTASVNRLATDLCWVGGFLNGLRASGRMDGSHRPVGSPPPEPAAS